MPKVLSYDETDRLLLSFDDLEDLDACRIMLFAGLRVEEASNLTIDDIDRERRPYSLGRGREGRIVGLRAMLRQSPSPSAMLIPKGGRDMSTFSSKRPGPFNVISRTLIARPGSPGEHRAIP